MECLSESSVPNYNSMNIEQLEAVLDNNKELSEAEKIEIVKLIVSKWEANQPKTEDETPPNKLKVLPKTLDEAVSLILKDMRPEDIEIIKVTKRSNLIKYHHGWGTNIRNTFGLWGGNKELIKSICNTPCHPDNASMQIIEAVWDKLHNKPLKQKNNN